MLFAESHKLRRIVGRLQKGDDLFASLTDVCRRSNVRTAELRALGSFESAEVAEYDQVRKVWKAGRTFVASGMELLNLTGNVSERDGALALHAHVTLMRDRDNGVEIIGGHLVSAKVFALEFVIEAFDDLILRRAVDDATGLTLWREAIPLAPPQPAAALSPPIIAPRPTLTSPVLPPVAPEPDTPFPMHPDSTPLRPSRAIASHAAPTWAQVAEISARREDAAPTLDPSEMPELSVGDIILHPAFGRCDVQRLEGDEFAHIRLKNGRLVRLALDFVSLTFAGREGEQNVFRAKLET